MSSSHTLDALGSLPLVRPENTDTTELHRHLLAGWVETMADRAATFDRTAGRKAAFHRKRLDELAGAGAAASGTTEKKLVTAQRAEAHWRDHVGRGEEFVERLVAGLRDLTETPISQVASWAVWDERTPGGTPWFERRGELEALTAGTDVPHTGAIFLGLETSMETGRAPWSAFHGMAGDGETGRDGSIQNLADHVTRTPLAGSYLTGYYKNLPILEEQILKALLDVASTPDKRALNTLMALIVRDEVVTFGLEPADTHAVALGHRVANLARKTMRDWQGILDMPDYTASVKTEAFRASADDALAVTHPGFTR